MKKLFTLSVGLLVLLLTVAGASAASDSKITETIEMGQASWYITNDNGEVVNVYLDIYKYSDTGTQIYVNAWGYDANGALVYDFYGSTVVEGDAFTVGKKLASASLSEVSVDVYNYMTYEYETVTIAADWTGVGDLTKAMYIIRGGAFITQRGTAREATATGSIVVDDVDLLGEETSMNAYLGQYTLTTMIKK